MVDSKRPLAIIKIENNSNESIEKLGITYDGAGLQLFNLKDIEVREIKQIEIPTEYFRNKTIIRMYTENGHVYSIKKDVSKNEELVILVTLKKVNSDGSLEFECH